MNSLTHSARYELKQKFQDIVSLDIDVAKISQWRIGGRISTLVTPRTVEELAQIRAWVDLHKLPSMVIGNTTNLLFNDDEVNAIVIKVGCNLSEIQIQGQEIIAKAGAYVPFLARKSMQQGLTGLEHTIGIPGTLGGLVCMNGGSQRKAIGTALTYIDAVDRTGNLTRYTPNECEFAYRSSIFQNLDHAIVEVGMKLEFAKTKAKVHRDMLQILRDRSKKFPRKLPNCGSVFVSIPEMYAEYGAPGRIIEECGLKGVVRGRAQISPLHANFIVNMGGATARDVLWLIEHIRSTVYNKTGYQMVTEAKFVDRNGKVLTI